jgi:hypothetical protein
MPNGVTRAEPAYPMDGDGFALLAGDRLELDEIALVTIEGGGGNHRTNAVSDVGL